MQKNDDDGNHKKLKPNEVLTKSHFGDDFISESRKSFGNCNDIKVSVLDQLLSGTNLEQPVFIKLMRKSHVSSTFWLGIPHPFSSRYLPMRDLLLTLETESGEVYETKYLSRKAAFSGGWRGFAVGEKLVEGDRVVFHLVDATRFKVYIIRKESSTVKLPTHLLNFYEEAKQCVMDDNQLIVYRRREIRQFGDEHCGKTGEISHIKRFDDFKIDISTLLQEHELSEDSLHAYYELCRAQNGFLHANLLKGVNPKIFVGAFGSTISYTIRIGIALRSCSLSTFLDNFSEWKKDLKRYEALGMNVGLLSARLDHLRYLAVSSDGAISRNKYVEACCERSRCECEVKKLEMILAKLRKVSIMLESKVKGLESEAGWENYTEAYFRLTQVRDEIEEIEGLIADFGKFFEQYDVVIKSLKPDAINHEHQFEKEAGAPWLVTRGCQSVGAWPI